MTITLGKGRWKRKCEVIGVGPTVLVVRDDQGYTRTIRKEDDLHGKASTEATEAADCSDQRQAEAG